MILSLTILTNQGHVVHIGGVLRYTVGGSTSGIFVTGRCDIFIPLVKDDHSGYYVLPVPFGLPVSSRTSDDLASATTVVVNGCHYLRDIPVTVLVPSEIQQVHKST